jgi:erythromycin esterase-like protein
MVDATVKDIAAAVRNEAYPIRGNADDYDPLMEMIGNSRLVLIGEASHGTHEFYAERAAITRRLIEEKGFTAIAVEADWPDAYRINRWVRGADGELDAIDSLEGFKRFPTWMWRNTVVLDFIGWLRSRNESLPRGKAMCGFYGLDLYSLFASIEAVIAYLEHVDPAAAKRARYRYGCFEDFGEDTTSYAYAASFDLDRSCEDAVVDQLVELRRRATEYTHHDGAIAEDEFFYAEQNARLVIDAEEYYRTMFGGHVASWNLRDTHMSDTLEALLEHLDQSGKHTKAVVWAHNSHLGDARATEMGMRAELNLGQLVRMRHREEACLIGFSTYTGSVTAASDWDGPAERKHVRAGLNGSYERLFHETGVDRFFLPMRDGGDAAEALAEPRLERAIGVIYRPETERMSHYFHARLPEQFDAVIHIDETRAVEPLERSAEWHSDEAPETFPSAL